MRKSVFFLIGVVFLFILTGPSCLAKDPILDVVIGEVKKDLQSEYGEDLAMVKKMTIFESTLKVYMTDDYPNDRLRKFAGATTKIYGERMRGNKKLFQLYHVTIFQNKKIDNKIQLKPIAECTFKNGSDQVEVHELGLGSGKYDIKD